MYGELFSFFDSHRSSRCTIKSIVIPAQSSLRWPQLLPLATEVTSPTSWSCVDFARGPRFDSFKGKCRSSCCSNSSSCGCLSGTCWERAEQNGTRTLTRHPWMECSVYSYSYLRSFPSLSQAKEKKASTGKMENSGKAEELQNE